MSNAKEKQCHKITPKTINNCLSQKDKNPSVGKKLNVKMEKKCKENFKKTISTNKEKNKNKKFEKKLIAIHHINCRSSIGKIEEIFQYTEEHNPDILLWSESKLGLRTK